MKPKRDIQEVKDIVQDIEEKTIAYVLKKSEEPLLFPSLDGKHCRVNVSKNKQQVKDTSVKDTSVKDTSVKDTKVKDTSVKDTSVKDTSVKDTSVKDTKVKDTSVKGTKGAGGDATVNEKKDDIDDINVKDVTVDVADDVDDDVTVDNADIELLGGTSPDVKTISIKKDYVGVYDK